MIWKKSWISYFLWACFSIIVCVTFSILAISESLEWNVNNRYAVIGVVCLSFLLLAGIYFLLRWLMSTIGSKITLNIHIKRIGEVIALLGSILAGVFFRLETLANMETVTESMAYINRAFVESGNVISDSHGATYFYLQSLRMLFMGFGNKAAVAFDFQIVLQVVTAIILYELIRNMVGKLPGILLLAGLMFSPEIIQKVADASCFNFYMLLLAIGIRVLWGFYKRETNIFYTIFFGILTAVLFYLDWMAIAIILAAICVLWVKDDNRFGAKMGGLGVFFLTFLVGLALLLGIQTLITGDTFLQTVFAFGDENISAWNSIAFTDYILADNSITNLCLYGVLFFLTIGFFERKEAEYLSPFVMLLLVMMCKREYRIYIEMMLAAVSVFLLYVPKMEKGPLPEKAIVEKQEPKKPEPEKFEPEKFEPEKPIVKLIENPLPVPKKHVAKELDYDITEVDDDYDYPVDDDDDFDK